MVRDLIEVRHRALKLTPIGAKQLDQLFYMSWPSNSLRGSERVKRCLHHEPRHRHATKASSLLNEGALRRRQRHKQSRPLNPSYRSPRPASRPRMRHRIITHLTRPSSHVCHASAAILRTTPPVCHATPYASRQKLNTDIGIIQLATRISGSGIQRRPSMTAQGHNLNVRPRKLSPVSSFRADRECGSSGPSTLTLHALSDRSLRAFRAASWALLTRSLSSHRASEQTKRWEITLPRCAHVVLVWFGWGRAPNGGGTVAASSRSFARPAGASLRPFSPCARTPVRH